MKKYKNKTEYAFDRLKALNKINFKLDKNLFIVLLIEGT